MLDLTTTILVFGLVTSFFVSRILEPRQSGITTTTESTSSADINAITGIGDINGGIVL
jgi:hypothetical protein